jgi:3-isopropylmalate dehydratase small subunit
MTGRVWVYGDDVNTDVIFPGRYLHLLEPAEMAGHAMEDLDPGFAGGVSKGDVIVAGKNFGCGSSREQAATCLLHSGVSTVIARSFARIFYRNAINLGIPIIISDTIPDAVKAGDEVAIDLGAGKLVNRTTGEELGFEPLPDFVLEIVNVGGLIPYTRRKLGLEE